MLVTQIRGVLFDVDGTLVNSNDAQAHSWMEAMSKYGYSISFERVRPLIGKGGDKLLPETIGVSKDSDDGKKISQEQKKIFMTRYLPTLSAFPCARELLEHMHAYGLKLAIATSAEPDELKGLLQIIGPHVQGLFKEETSAKDAEHSKPSPDIMHAALERLGYSPEQVMMVGDTPYDIESAARVHVGTIAFRSGEWKDSHLSGAVAIYNDTADLLAHYDTSPLA